MVSVVVCTYNRAEELKACLQSLVEQTASNADCEVLIVDNNSTDQTANICSKFLSNQPNFYYYVETQQGLSFARNRGWKEARGQYVAYIDDDARAYPDWLEKMLDFIQRHPDVEAFGGPYLAFAEQPIPNWFPPEYGTKNMGDDERRIFVGTEFLSGTNMVFKKKVLEDVGGFNVRLGMVGDKPSYGEETRLQLDLDRSGFVVYYLPQLKVEHLVAAYKLSLRWLLKSAFAGGRSSGEAFNKKRSLTSYIYILSKAVCKGGGGFFSPVVMPLKRRVYIASREIAWALGIWAEGLSLGHKRIK